MKQKGMEPTQSRSQAGQRVGLRLVEAEGRGCRRKAAKTECRRALVDADQSAPDQRLQRGGG